MNRVLGLLEMWWIKYLKGGGCSGGYSLRVSQHDLKFNLFFIRSQNIIILANKQYIASPNFPVDTKIELVCIDFSMVSHNTTCTIYFQFKMFSRKKNDLRIPQRLKIIKNCIIIAIWTYEVLRHTKTIKTVRSLFSFYLAWKEI